MSCEGRPGHRGYEVGNEIMGGGGLQVERKDGGQYLRRREN